jgi:hypothetical protein
VSLSFQGGLLTYPVRPLIRSAAQHGLQDADANDLAEAPAEVNVGGQVAAQGDGAHLGGVGDCQGLEDTPRDAAQDLGNLQVDDGLRGEEDGHEAGDQDQAGHDRVAVAETLGNPAVDEQAEDLAHVGTIAEPGLPGRRDLVREVGQLFAVLLPERGEAWSSQQWIPQDTHIYIAA